MTLDKPIKAKCCGCPFVGWTKQPDYYLCGCCYYARKAASGRDSARRHREQAARADAVAAEYEAKAARFLARHPQCGGAR